MEKVYGELHRIAAQCFRRERNEHTLQATALLHEAVLRLMDLDSIEWSDRGHFYAVAARMMRRILVDHAREQRRLKRGGADTCARRSGGDRRRRQEPRHGGARRRARDARGSRRADGENRRAALLRRPDQR